MAFTRFMLQLFNKLNSEIDSTVKDRPKKILSLGYPDMLVSREFLSETFGNNLGEKIPYHEESESIMRWHNVHNHLEGIPDTRAFLEELGYQLDIVDIVQARGAEIILDLNYPIDQKFHQQYDIIIDGGTIEHCFNIAQAIKNIALSVREGGFILNCNPFSCFNHGFYNLNPTFYFDFYTDNGFDIVFQELIINAVVDPKLISVPPTRRFIDGPIDASNILIAQRHTVQDIEWPVQTKYKINSGLKG
ncbi:MAG: hypothetical protein OEZ43_05485 [Gammaproteobacteria bacterium]|nr:hypothetical protein [Gammaproteobacteria bacterium]